MNKKFKTTLRQAWGMCIILSVGASVVLWTTFDVVEILLAITGCDFNEDLLWAGLSTLPLLCYTWYYWLQKDSINKIKKLLYD